MQQEQKEVAGQETLDQRILESPAQQRSKLWLENMFGKNGWLVDMSQPNKSSIFSARKILSAS